MVWILYGGFEDVVIALVIWCVSWFGLLCYLVGLFWCLLVCGFWRFCGLVGEFGCIAV